MFFLLLLAIIDIYFVPPAAAKRERVFRGHPEPRQRTPSSALLFKSLLAAAKRGKGVFRDALLHPPDTRPRTPAKDSVLCTPVFHYQLLLYFAYAFLKVQVTLPKESLSPSLIGVALSGSRRLPLMRVEFVLFRSVMV